MPHIADNFQEWEQTVPKKWQSTEAAWNAGRLRGELHQLTRLREVERLAGELANIGFETDAKYEPRFDRQWRRELKEASRTLKAKIEEGK